jgi:hypothetical protein
VAPGKQVPCKFHSELALELVEIPAWRRFVLTLSRGWPTTTHIPNPTPFLFLYSPHSKNNFYTFTRLKRKSEEYFEVGYANMKFRFQCL